MEVCKVFVWARSVIAKGSVMEKQPAGRLSCLIEEYANVKLFPITLAVSTGRCGTTYLKTLFSESYGHDGLFLHEHLSAHEAKPATFFRCYEYEEQEKITQPEVKKSDSAYLLDVLSFFHCLGPGFCKEVSGIL